MKRPSCLDLAIECPDIKCPKCNKPYQTWVWKEDLLFTCPDCNELGFSIEGKNVKEENLPENSFFTDMEWPCEDDPDPGCHQVKKMLFIENYKTLDFLNGKFEGNNTVESYSTMQKRIGMAYENLVEGLFDL